MGNKLSPAQTRALTHLKKHPNQWRNDTPVTQRCLNTLKRKGLVLVAYDPLMGWCEKITEKGMQNEKQ